MKKSKIAISLNNDLLKIIDNKTDGSVIRSRSQAIEYFVKKGLREDSVNIAVLLLKGNQQNIALKNFKGKSLIKNQVEFFLNKGIQKIFLLTQKPVKELREELINSNMEIIDTDSNGNASALLFLKNKIKENFIAMSGDTYNDFDLNKMITKHFSINKLATMGLMTRENSSKYGTAILDGDYIVEFKEKPKSTSSHIVNAGIYIFKPEIFELIHGDSLEKELFPKLAKIKELIGFFTYGEYWHFHKKLSE